MYIKTDPESGVPLYLQIVKQVKRLVAHGALRPGDRLPAVRELALQLRINPNTVARAYRELQHAEIISPKWGEGSFIADGAAALAEKGREDIVAEILADAVAQARSLGLSDDELSRLFEKARGKRRE